MVCPGRALRCPTYPSPFIAIFQCLLPPRRFHSLSENFNILWCGRQYGDIISNAITAVFLCPGRILTPCTYSSNQHISGSRHRAKNIILSGNPCRIPQRIGIGADKCPLKLPIALEYIRWICHANWSVWSQVSTWGERRVLLNDTVHRCDYTASVKLVQRGFVEGNPVPLPLRPPQTQKEWTVIEPESPR
jgi:hypothetical protein